MPVTTRKAKTPTPGNEVVAEEGSGPCLCSTCNQKVTTNAIQCNRCNSWVHCKQACSGLPNKLVNILYNYDGDAIEFICTGCRLAPDRPAARPESADSIADIWKAINQLFLTVQGLAENTAQIKAASNNSNPAQPTMDRDSIRALMRTELIELKERDKRRTSVVVKGIPYSTQEEFLRKFATVTHSLINKDISPTDVTPIRPNYVRMTVDNRDDRLSLIAASPRLKKMKDFSHIFISKDLTYQQRTALRERRLARNTPNSNSVATGANSVPIENVVRVPPLSPSEQPIPPTHQPINNSHLSVESPSQPQPTAPPISPNVDSSSSSFRDAINLFSSPADSRMRDSRPSGSPNAQSVVSSETSTVG